MRPRRSQARPEERKGIIMATVTSNTCSPVTTESLASINKDYAFHHGFTGGEAKIVEELRRDIEETRRNVPVAGDVVIIRARNGKVYPTARVDNKEIWYGPGKTGFCTDPSVPWALGKYRVEISGGYFESANTNRFRHVGNIAALFKTWGCWGHRAQGNVNFYAIVNLWELTAGELY